MARAPRDHRLETAEARGKLTPNREPYWRQLHEGLFIGYRKGSREGAWYVRTYEDGRYRKRKLAVADDTGTADGIAVLTYRQAVRQAVDGTPAERISGYTVADALDDYLGEFEHRARSYPETKARADKHIRPDLGPIAVESLTTKRLRNWMQSMVGNVEGEDQRRRRATANRVLTVLKAALNQAYRDGRVRSDNAWRRVQPYRNADQPRIRHLTYKQSVKLVNACEPDFRALVRGALLTGCRYGELIEARVGDYDAASATLHVARSKSGGARRIPLTAEGSRLLDEITEGRGRSERLFLRADGEPWGKSHQHARMRAACQSAEIDPPVGFHILRHTFGSLLAQKGVPLQVIATALGHADTRMTHRHYAHLQPDHVADHLRESLPTFSGSSETSGAHGGDQ